MNFQGRCAIVTGAAAGIGFASAELLAEGGASLYLTDIDGEKLEESAQKLRETGVTVYTAAGDVADEKSAYAAVTDAAQKFGKIDILVNNAGIYRTKRTSFADSEPDTWRRKIDVNIYGTLYYTHAVLPHMLKAGYGRIVNLSSVAAVYGIAMMTDYSMTKGAILGFTKALAKEVTASGVTVNAVSPGSISDDPDKMPNHSFMGRSGSFRECAQVIAFLASEEASYVSGQNYIVDGCRKLM